MSSLARWLLRRCDPKRKRGHPRVALIDLSHVLTLIRYYCNVHDQEPIVTDLSNPFYSRGMGYSDIHVLKFRESELNSTHTRYDNTVAGGSDRERKIQWTIYASIALIVAAFVLAVLISILRKAEVRKKSFNLFLIFLIIPDVVFSLFCGINCALNAAKGDFVSAGWCRFQVIYCVWGIGSNAWLNAVIARHLHRMLTFGNRRQRYFPPSNRQVILESMMVYTWMAFLSSWPFIEFMPHRIGLSAGLACLPHEYDTASTVFFWVVFMPCFALIPTAYTFYVAFDCYRRKLLPKTGRQRDLAIYFSRLVVVFLVMWVPSIFLMFIAGGFLSSWVSFIGGTWSHLQGAVSAIASIMKADIRRAFCEFISCKSSEADPDVSFSFPSKIPSEPWSNGVDSVDAEDDLETPPDASIAENLEP